MSDQNNAIVVVEPSGEHPLEMIIDAVLDDLGSDTSRRVYQQSIDQFLNWLGAYKRSSVNKGTVAAYKRFLEEERELAAATVNRHLSAVKKLISEAADHGMFDESMLSAIKRVKGAKQKGSRAGNWLTREQALRLLETPDLNTRKGARDQAILAVLVGCGLRRQELVDMTYSHMQSRDGHWVFVDLVGKGGRVRTVKIPPWGKRAIDYWTEMSGRYPGPDDYIFVSIKKGHKIVGKSMTAQAIYYLVVDYCKLAGLPEITPHDLRRTFAKLSRKGGAQLEQLQLTLGHASVQTTERYVGATLDLDDNAVDYTGLRTPRPDDH
jgi:integrase